MDVQHLAAILIQLAATSLTNVGFALEKKAADELPNIEEAGGSASFKNFLSNKTWLAGFMFVNVGALLVLVAIGLAPLSLVMPLQGAGLAVLALFSKFYLKEDIGKVEYGGVVLAIVGVILIGLVPAPPSESTTTEVYQSLYGMVGLVFFVVVIAIMVILFFLGRAGEFKRAGLAFSTISGVAAALGFTLSKGFSVPLTEQGLVATLNLILAWLSLGLYLVTMVLSTVFGQWAFQKGKAVVCTPNQVIFQIITPVVSGAVIFGELAGRVAQDLVLYGVALAIMLTAVVILGVASGRREALGEKLEATLGLEGNQGTNGDDDPGINA